MSSEGSIADRIRETFSAQRAAVDATDADALGYLKGLIDAFIAHGVPQNLYIGALGPGAVNIVGAMGDRSQGTAIVGADPAGARNAPALKVVDRSVFRLPRALPAGPLRFDERYRTTTETRFGLDRAPWLAVLADRADADLAAELTECETELAEGLERCGMPRREWRRIDVDHAGTLTDRAALNDPAADGWTPAVVLRVPRVPAHAGALKALVIEITGRKLFAKAPVIVQVTGASLAAAVHAAKGVLPALDGRREQSDLTEFAVRASWHGVGGRVPPTEDTVEAICSDDPALTADVLQAVRATDFDSWAEVLRVVSAHEALGPTDDLIVKTSLDIAMQSDTELDLWIGDPKTSPRDFTPGKIIAREHFNTFVLGLLRNDGLLLRPRLKSQIRHPLLREMVQLHLRHAADWGDGERLYDHFDSETASLFAWRSGLARPPLLDRAEFQHLLDWAGLHRTRLSADTVDRLTELDHHKRQLIGFVEAERTLDTLRAENLAELGSVARPSLH